MQVFFWWRESGVFWNLCLSLACFFCTDGCKNCCEHTGSFFELLAVVFWLAQRGNEFPTTETSTFGKRIYFNSFCTRIFRYTSWISFVSENRKRVEINSSAVEAKILVSSRQVTSRNKLAPPAQLTQATTHQTHFKMVSLLAKEYKTKEIVNQPNSTDETITLFHLIKLNSTHEHTKIKKKNKTKKQRKKTKL